MRPPETDRLPGSEALVGQDGNAFAVMGFTRRACARAGADDEWLTEMLTDARGGDYDHLLLVCMTALDGDWR